MLTKFTVSDYRGLRGPVTLDLSHPRDYAFNTGYVTSGVISNAMVMGPCACGKTSLITALADMRTNLYPPDILALMGEPDDFFVNADSKEGVARLSYDFDFDGTQLTYRYAKDHDRRIVRETLELDGMLVFDWGPDGLSEDSDLSLVGAATLNRAFADEYSSILAYVSSNVELVRGGVLGNLRAFASGTTVLAQDGWGSSRALSVLIARIIKADRVGDLEAFLRGFGIEETLEVLPCADGGRALYCHHAHPVPFVQCASSGTRMLTGIFCALEDLPRQTLLLLDDLDSHLYYEQAERLVRLLGSNACAQAIFTARSTSLVRCDVMRPDCVFTFGADGSLDSLAQHTSRELRFGHNVERLLRNGEFD